LRLRGHVASVNLDAAIYRRSTGGGKWRSSQVSIVRVSPASPIANDVHKLRPSARIWAFKVPTTAPHSSGGPPFPNPNPSGSGFATAHIFQFDQQGTITVPGVGKLVVDLDSALTADPGI
jgi:hypothetical protein